MIYHPFRHLGLKAISVALAALIWLSVSGEPIVERSLRVPLELQNVPEKLEMVDSPPGTVDVRVRGGEGLLSHLTAGDVVAVLDLSLARPGRRFIPLTTDRVHGPVGVEVTQVAPTSISLDFEPAATRSVHVVPSIEGQPAPGFTVASVTSQPDAVDVVGPDSALKSRQTRVITEPISIAGATAPASEWVTLGVAAPGLRLKTPGKAKVTVDIRPIAAQRTIGDVSIGTRHLAAGRRAQVAPLRATVTVAGELIALNDLTPDRFAAFVDLAGLGPGQYNRKIQIEPPPNVQIVSIEPASVTVRIR